MDFNIAVIAIVEILSSLTTGIVILWMTYRGLKLFGKRMFDITAKNNLSYSIFMASVLFSVGYSVSSVIQPLVSSFRLLSHSSEGALSLSTSFILYGGFYVAIAYIASICITVIGVFIYINLTPVDEFKEIKNNNIAVAIVVSSIIITLNLISKSGVALLIESLLPYPNLPPL